LIFLTVGTQLPFDRLVRAMDAWCAEHPEHEVFGQIGDTGRNGYLPRNFPYESFLSPASLDRRIQTAETIVAHAGMGSIITALLNAKPIVIMPRRAHLGEQRNDHQYGTAEAFGKRPLVHPAFTDADLPDSLTKALNCASCACEVLGQFGEERLLNSLRDFIHSPSALKPEEKEMWLQPRRQGRKL